MNANSFPLLACAALLLSAVSSAQTAKFTEFGSACAGSTSSSQVLLSSNSDRNTLQSLIYAQTSEVAIEVKGPLSTPMVVTGFELLTKARNNGTQVFGHFHLADSTGAPLQKPTATGTMMVDSAVRWYAMTLRQPLVVQPGSKLFISWTDTRVPFSTTIDWPVPTAPTQGPSTSYHRFTSGGSWGPGLASNSWAYRVLGPSQALRPDLNVSAAPKLGSSIDVLLFRGLPSSAGALILGASKQSWGGLPLPLSLQPLGGGSCSLLVSMDVLGPVALDTSGNASLRLPIPGDPGLAGLPLQLQWLVVDGPANPLGLSFSEGGTLLLGN
jgi:hypothetical protein